LGAAAGAGLLVPSWGAFARGRRDFKISVAGWSMHREVQSGQISQRQIFRVMREEFEIDAFELVNTMLEVPTSSYVDQIRRESGRYNVAIPLIMIDSEGNLGDADANRRKRAVRDHHKWIYVASDLGCHSVRVNWRGEPRNWQSDEAAATDFVNRSTEAFKSLCEFGAANGINVIIENHGGPSSYPAMLTRLIRAVDSPNFGTLPDFGNFPNDVDRYDAVDRMMPFAKAVSAKCYDFGADGNETRIDFERMLQICVDKHGYSGFIGIEYEGNRMSEREGIRAARDLLIKLRG
jgi:sugar phosphate isomerase/epimerase